MKRGPSLAWLLWLVSGAAAAAPLPPEEALVRAVEDHPAVRAALARAREADASARLTAMGPNEWTLSADAAQRRSATEGRFDEWETALERGVRLPGKAALDRELARLEGAAAAAGADAARRVARSAILEDWFACLRAREHARLAEADAEAASRIGEAVAVRHRVGDAAALDLALADAEVAASAAEAASSRSAAVGAARLLATRLADADCESARWADPADGPTGQGPFASGPRAGVPAAIDPLLRQQELAAERASRLAERAALERWPDPTLGVRYGSERNGDERIGGLYFSVPLGGPRRSAEAARARAAAEAAAAELDVARAERARSTLELEVAWRSAAAAWRQFAQAALRQDEAARLALRAWELGESPLSDALLQRRAALQARLAERDAAIDAWRAAALHAALHGKIPPARDADAP